MKAIIGVFACGFLALLIAVLIQVIVPKIVNSEVKKNLEIKDDVSSLRYKQWKCPSIPIRIEFYVFDILNKDEMKQGKKPLVQQRGPYSYKEYMDKMDIHFNNSKPLVSYDQKKWFIFEQDKSCLTCHPYNDTVTTINTPFVIMAEVASSYPAIAKFIIDIMLKANKEDLLMTKTVHELIWGYNDPLFEQFAQLRKKYDLFFIPEISPFMNFQPNDTFDGDVTANTGREDINKVGVWQTWKGQHSLNIWKTTYANMLNGSDGTQFPPGVKRDKMLYFFSPNLCRSIYIRYDSDKEIKGINVLRFTTPKELFQNGSQNPDNAAFCPHRCYPDGILAGSQDCKATTTESPIVISTPHFLIADSFLRDGIEGLQPDREKHGLFLSIEPLTGIPLQALIRLQINLHIRPVQGIVGTTGIRESYVPVLYFSNEVTVDDKTAKMMRDEIFLTIKICNYSKICLFTLGGLLIIVAAVMFGLRKTKSVRKSKQKQINSNKSEPTLSEKTPLIPDEHFKNV